MQNRMASCSPGPEWLSSLSVEDRTEGRYWSARELAICEGIQWREGFPPGNRDSRAGGPPDS